MAAVPPKAVYPSSAAEDVPLEQLELDPKNPRFGGTESIEIGQTEILDRIVQTYGVGDVISSLAVNGYFRAEPLVGRRGKDNKVTIVEGNRRLAACLVLSEDPRSKNQTTMADQPRQLWARHNKPTIDPLPVIIFEAHTANKELLSYLGVRHISASAPWDSYAKAAWVATVVENASLSVAEVAQMVGDKHQTVSRLLEGYYFINQAERTGQFIPQNSQRSGRGSVTAYPFSWVYTVLGYTAARNFVGMIDGYSRINPIPENRLWQAGLLCRAMFGDKSKGLSSAVSDSRELGDLASVFASPEKLALLEQGKSVANIVRVSRPLDDRLRRNLNEIKTLQNEVVSGLAESKIDSELANLHLQTAVACRRQAAAIVNTLKEAGDASDVD